GPSRLGAWLAPRAETSSCAAMNSAWTTGWVKSRSTSRHAIESDRAEIRSSHPFRTSLSSRARTRPLSIALSAPWLTALTIADGSPSRKVVSALKRSEEHTSELQSRFDLVCRLLLEKKNNEKTQT